MINFIDFIFEKNCIFCREGNQYLCDNCINTKIHKFNNFICPGCQQKISKFSNYVHTDCIEKTNIAGIYCCYKYTRAFKYLLHQYKYNRSFALAEDFRRITWQHLANIPFAIDIITYVPLHTRKEQDRGFNQVELVLRNYSRNVHKLLTRNVDTRTQAGLNRESRIANSESIFKIAEKAQLIKDKNILIVDDVYTTGSTIESCAQVLITNGASKVFAFTWAHGH